MKAKIVILCVFLFSCSFVSAQSETEQATLIKAGAAMPAFTVKTLAGKTIDSKEFKGQSGFAELLGHLVPPLQERDTLPTEGCLRPIQGQGFHNACRFPR